MISVLRVIFACLIVSTAGVLSAFPAQADTKPHREIVQTFEPARNNGTPLVQVRFSSTVIGTFAIDTGEYESVITDDFVKRTQLKPKTDNASNFFGFLHYQFIQVPEIRLENLTIAGPIFRQVPQNFLFPFNGRSIDGILGGDILSQFALRIDYPAHEIDWITPGNLDAKATADLGFSPQNLIELGQERTFWDRTKVNHYSLSADFHNGDHASSEDLIIDTGSPATLVSNALAEKLNLAPLSMEMHATLSNPLAPFNRSTVAKMQVGHLTLSDVSLVAPQRKDMGFPSLLGENVLSDCVVLLDFGPHRFYLKPVLPPAKEDSVAPLDKKLIVWDRLRVAPDLPTVEEMLSTGFAPDAQDTLAEQAARLRVPDPDSAKDIKRLEKLGALLHEGQDEAGAKAAFTQAVMGAAAAAHAHPDDGMVTEQWVQALALADRGDEAIAAATQTTVRLPKYAPGWRLLGDVLMSHAISILAGQRLSVTKEEVLKLTRNVPGSQATPAQTVLVQPLLVQAHAACDKAIALAPSDAEGYQERGLFRLVSRIALTALQQANIKITLPASEVPSEDTALALAVADWQQCAALSSNNAERLSATAYLDQNLPVFHDRAWLTAHLKGTAGVLPAALMTTDAVQTRLVLLTKNTDRTLAVSAWTALGTVQAGKGDVLSTECEASWRQALTLDPSHAEALASLASHLYHADRWTELRDLLTRQAAAHDAVPTRLALAAVLSGEGLPADAEAQVRAARTLAPDNASVNLILADLLLTRSSGDAAALAEASACLSKASLGYGTLATPEQEATLTTTQAVWLALDHDPDAAKKQLVSLAKKQPNCTQVREALAALVPY